MYNSDSKGAESGDVEDFIAVLYNRGYLHVLDKIVLGLQLNDINALQRVNHQWSKIMEYYRKSDIPRMKKIIQRIVVDACADYIESCKSSLRDALEAVRNPGWFLPPDGLENELDDLLAYVNYASVSPDSSIARSQQIWPTIQQMVSSGAPKLRGTGLWCLIFVVSKHEEFVTALFSNPVLISAILENLKSSDQDLILPALAVVRVLSWSGPEHRSLIRFLPSLAQHLASPSISLSKEAFLAFEAIFLLVENCIEEGERREFYRAIFSQPLTDMIQQAQIDSTIIDRGREILEALIGPVPDVSSGNEVSNGGDSTSSEDQI